MKRAVGATRFVVAGVAAVAILVMGCAAPTDGPEKVAADYLDALSSRDGARVWAQLAPAEQARIKAVYATLLAARSLILKHYPDAAQDQALAASGADAVGGAIGSAEALFLQLFGSAGESGSVSGLVRLGTRPRDVFVANTASSADGTATIKTWGGNEVSLVAVEDVWKVRLGTTDAARLSELQARAERALAGLQREVAGRESHRFGAVRK